MHCNYRIFAVACPGAVLFEPSGLVQPASAGCSRGADDYRAVKSTGAAADRSPASCRHIPTSACIPIAPGTEAENQTAANFTS